MKEIGIINRRRGQIVLIKKKKANEDRNGIEQVNDGTYFRPENISFQRINIEGKYEKSSQCCVQEQQSRQEDYNFLTQQESSQNQSCPGFWGFDKEQAQVLKQFDEPQPDVDMIVDQCFKKKEIVPQISDTASISNAQTKFKFKTKKQPRQFTRSNATSSANSNSPILYQTTYQSGVIPISGFTAGSGSGSGFTAGSGSSSSSQLTSVSLNIHKKQQAEPVKIIDQRQVRLENYRKQVNRQLGLSAATTGFNAFQAGYKTYKKMKENKNYTQKEITKQILKVSGKEACKGMVGMGGKLVEQTITKKRILENVTNADYKVGGVGKFGINAGVEVGKEVVNYVFSGKQLNKENLVKSGKKVALNTLEFGTTQVLNKGVSKLVPELVETVANYSAKNVASSVGKVTVNTVIKEGVEETGKAIFSTALNTGFKSLKSNAIGAGIGLVVGTAFDCARGESFGSAVKKNSKEAVGSTVGSALGAAIGSVVPVVGTAVGGFVGGLLGGLVSSWF